MMKLKYPICCGLDVHKNVIVATIVITNRDGVSEYRQKSFSTINSDIQKFHNWLIENNCYHVCMESTGKYWIPIFNYLENSAGQQINQDLFHLFSHHTVSSSIFIFRALAYSMTEFPLFFPSDFLRISIFALFIKSLLLVSLFCPAFPASLISPCHFQPQIAAAGRLAPELSYTPPCTISAAILTISSAAIRSIMGRIN